MGAKVLPVVVYRAVWDPWAVGTQNWYYSHSHSILYGPGESLEFWNEHGVFRTQTGHKIKL